MLEVTQSVESDLAEDGLVPVESDLLPVEPFKNKLLLLLASRKFWAALIGLALVVLKSYRPDFPLSEEQVTNLVYVLMAYILGTAIEDGGRAVNNGYRP